MNEDSAPDLLSLTADVVAAYVSNNTLPPEALSGLITDVHAALSRLGKPTEVAPEQREPAVNPKRSITNDYIISLEDGLKYKTLKRHLGRLGMTPQEYRAKWNLPSTYPMVAAGYSARRSELARSLGLGRRSKQPELQATPEPEARAPKKTRGRKSAGQEQAAPESAKPEAKKRGRKPKSAAAAAEIV